MEAINKTYLLLLTIILSTVSFGKPPPPVISETFSTHYQVKSPGEPDAFSYTGEAHCDYDEMKVFSTAILSGPGLPVEHIWEYDLYSKKESYIYDWTGSNLQPDGVQCEIDNITTDFGPMWAWTKEASYNNTITYDNRPIDVFIGYFNDTVMVVGVDHSNTSIPYFLEENAPGFAATYLFQNFTPTTPDPKLFNIPNDCGGDHYLKQTRPAAFKLHRLKWLHK